MTLNKTFFAEWSNIRCKSLEVAELIPDDVDYTFTPHEKMKSLGTLITHIIAANYKVLNQFLHRNLEMPAILQNKKELSKLEYIEQLNTTNSIVKNLLNELEVQDLDKPIIENSKESRTYQWAIKHLEEHEIHHNAQLKLYLRLLDIDTSSAKFCK